MRKFKSIIVSLAAVASLGLGTQASAQFNEGNTIPKFAMAASESGSLAGLFDELNKTLNNDYLYLRELSINNILSKQGPFTVLAPTSGAFDALKQTLACNGIALTDIPEIVRTVLAYHAIQGAFFAEDVVGAGEIPTLAGATILEDNGVLTDVAGQTINILFTDFEADNGVVHVIDTVMLPATLDDLGLVACP